MGSEYCLSSCSTRLYRSTKVPHKARKKKKEKIVNRIKSVAKADALGAVEPHAGNPLAGIELLVNQLDSDTMTDAGVVDVWGYDDLVELIIVTIEKSVIPRSIVPDVTDWFFCKIASPRGLSDTPWGFTTHTHKPLSLAMLPTFTPNSNPNQPYPNLSDLSYSYFLFLYPFLSRSMIHPNS